MDYEERKVRDHLVADLVGLLGALKLDRVRLVAHDWGAAISWEQRLEGYYTLLFRPPGFSERLLRSANWLGLRTLTGYPEELPRSQSQLSCALAAAERRRAPRAAAARLPKVTGGPR